MTSSDRGSHGPHLHGTATTQSGGAAGMGVVEDDEEDINNIPLADDDPQGNPHLLQITCSRDPSIR